MGCFLACFGGDKDPRPRKPAGRCPSREGVAERCRCLQPGPPSPGKQLQSPSRKPLQPSSPLEQRQQLRIPTLKQSEGPQIEHEEDVIPGSHPELRDTKEERRSALEQLPKEEEEEAEASSPLLGLRGKAEKPSFGSPRKKVTFDLNVKSYEQATDDEVYLSQEMEGEGEKPPRDGALTPLGSGASTVNHRYQNCVFSDDEDIEEDEDDSRDYIDDNCGGDVDDEEFEDCVFDADKDAMDRKGNEEESFYDSYFSLPLEREKHVFTKVISAAKPTACSSPDGQPTLMAGQAARDRSQYVHSVLNPVENLSQWKEVKAKAQPLKHPKKENINVEQGPEVPFSFQPSFKLPKSQKTSASTTRPDISTKHEVPVDASLSNWLPSSAISPVEGSTGNSSCRTKSSVSLDDRPILGALTMEDLKKHSLSSSSPRRSPSRNPDEIPILGPVGSYWSWTNGGTDSALLRNLPQIPKEYQAPQANTERIRE